MKGFRAHDLSCTYMCHYSQEATCALAGFAIVLSFVNKIGIQSTEAPAL